MGGTAVAPGFKWKPAEPQPMGVFQKECWNTYRVLQEQLGWNTQKETQPLYGRGEELHNNSLLLGAVIVIGSARMSREFSSCPALLALRMSLWWEYSRPVVGEGEGHSVVQKHPNHRTLVFTMWTLLLRNVRGERKIQQGQAGSSHPYKLKEKLGSEMGCHWQNGKIIVHQEKSNKSPTFPTVHWRT